MTRSASGPPAATRAEVRRRLEEEIGRLNAAPLTAAAERELRLYRQLAAGLDRLAEETIPRDRAGFGSRVYVRDVPSGRERAHNLVLGELDPFDAGQLSLDSPLGAALLGAQPGDEAEARLGEREVRVRVFNVRTLPRRLGMEEG